MSLFNMIVRALPKKRVDIDKLDRKNVSSRVEYTKTVKREALRNEVGNAPTDSTDEDGMVDGEYEILEREIMPEKIICPDCGGITLEGLEFCDKCGGDLTNY